MDLVDRLRGISKQAAGLLKHIGTEEATKNAFVMPFIQALGYNVFNPTEVVPEFTADVGTKKGEKVDYAILREGRPVILIEVKSATARLNDEHASQLLRYFTVTEARIAILTNGLEYRFYADLDNPNVMDEEPFMALDIRDFGEGQIAALDVLRKSEFDLERVIAEARASKYRNRMREIINKELNPLSEELIKFFIGKIHAGRVTSRVMNEYAPYVKEAWRDIVEQKHASLSQPEPQAEKPAAAPPPSGGGKEIPIFAVYKRQRFEAVFLLGEEVKIKQRNVRYDGEMMSPSESGKRARLSVNPDVIGAINGWRFWKFIDPDTGEARFIGELLNDAELVRRLLAGGG